MSKEQNKNTEPENTQDESISAQLNQPESDSKTTALSLATLRMPFAFVIALVLLSGIVHGIIDGRWSRPDDLIAQGSRLSGLPEQCGNWSLVETRELDEDAANVLQCYGSEVRVYSHEPSGISVTAAVLFGRRGPIAVHTPEICYSSVGTKQVGSRKVQTIRCTNMKGHFWSVQFAEAPSAEPSLDVWYGWSDGGDWVASEHPRFWMTDNLYKIQIAGPVGDNTFSPCEDFLTAFLPDLNNLIE